MPAPQAFMGEVTIFSVARCDMRGPQRQQQQLSKWVILLVAFDDPELDAEVIKERIGADEDEEMAAFLRGAELVAVMADEDEAVVEGFRRAVEKQCLR